jgi:hypothetical protein
LVEYVVEKLFEPVIETYAVQDIQEQPVESSNDEADSGEQEMEDDGSRETVTATGNDSSSLFAEDYIEGSNIDESTEETAGDNSAADNVVALPTTNSSDK